MKRLAKPEGKYNLVLEEAPVPEPGPGGGPRQGGAAP